MHSFFMHSSGLSCMHSFVFLDLFLFVLLPWLFIPSPPTLLYARPSSTMFHFIYFQSDFYRCYTLVRSWFFIHLKCMFYDIWNVESISFVQNFAYITIKLTPLRPKIIVPYEKACNFQIKTCASVHEFSSFFP